MVDKFHLVYIFRALRGKPIQNPSYFKATLNPDYAIDYYSITASNVIILNYIKIDHSKIELAIKP